MLLWTASGYNEKYGLLGSNKSTEDKIKLFPRDCFGLVEDIQKEILSKNRKACGGVMVYGDARFKDPKGKIWELADPIVSPAFTEGLIGTPNEMKLKYLADNDFKDLSGEALKEAISRKIREKDGSLVGNMASQGTTPQTADRSDRIPLRPDQRIWRQGHTHCLSTGIFRQLHG